MTTQVDQPHCGRSVCIDMFRFAYIVASAGCGGLCGECGGCALVSTDAGWFTIADGSPCFCVVLIAIWWPFGVIWGVWNESGRP